MQYLLCFQVWEIILMNKWNSQDSYHVGGYSIERGMITVRGKCFKANKTRCLWQKIPWSGDTGSADRCQKMVWEDPATDQHHVRERACEAAGTERMRQRVQQGQRAWEEASSWPAETHSMLRNELSEFYTGQTSQSFADHADLELSSAWGENMLEGVSNRGKKQKNETSDTSSMAG